ncbi:MAG: DivIVA domain-containing protein, partial [Acidimicrobiales bacterium]
MAEEYHTVVSSGALHPGEVARRTFDTVRRGYDPAAVRAFLERAGDELERLVVREAELRQRLADAERRAANPELDEQTLTRGLGQETTKVLAGAHEAANDIRARAEENAARILRQAHEEAARLQGAAESVLGERTATAQAEARRILEAAEERAAALGEETRAEAAETLAGARDEGQELLREARELRARVLADLARRRRVLHLQVERLRAGRESLLEAVRSSKVAFETLEDGLARAEADARLAAEAAARQVASETEPGVAELEATLALGRQGQLVGPAPPQPSPAPTAQPSPAPTAQPSPAPSAQLPPAPSAQLPP